MRSGSIPGAGIRLADYRRDKMVTKQTQRGTERVESADEAEVGDEKPKKVCQYESDYGRRPCGQEAVRAGFARTESRVNDHGVHVTTEARVVWLCEDHADIYPAVPDREADVRGRLADSDSDRNV